MTKLSVEAINTDLFDEGVRAVLSRHHIQTGDRLESAIREIVQTVTSTQQAQMREEHEEEMECLALNLKENHRIKLAQMREKIEALPLAKIPVFGMDNCVFLEDVLALFDRGGE
jgi:hypothetical protein